MSRPGQPAPAKLVVGMFMRDRKHFEAVTAELVAGYGDLDIVSSWMPFDYTSYYEQEMGAPLFRRMVVFQGLIQQDELATIKLATNALENGLRQKDKRQINIDPGYLLLERFVLASGKNFSHRIYIGKGIYADLTLIYQHGGFKTLPWTYPDYADIPMTDFLCQVRAKYAMDLKGQGRA
jgi:hypothetical protein